MYYISFAISQHFRSTFFSPLLISLVDITFFFYFSFFFDSNFILFRRRIFLVILKIPFFSSDYVNYRCIFIRIEMNAKRKTEGEYEEKFTLSKVFFLSYRRNNL